MKNHKLITLLMSLLFVLTACDTETITPTVNNMKYNFITVLKARQHGVLEVSQNPFTFQIDIFGNNKTRALSLTASHMLIPEEASLAGIQQFGGEFALSFEPMGTIFGYYEGRSVQVEDNTNNDTENELSDKNYYNSVDAYIQELVSGEITSETPQIRIIQDYTITGGTGKYLNASGSFMGEIEKYSCSNPFSIVLYGNIIESENN